MEDNNFNKQIVSKKFKESVEWDIFNGNQDKTNKLLYVTKCNIFNRK